MCVQPLRALEAAQRRRQQSRADARRTILDAAEALIVADGFDAFSMRRLAERCGYTAPTIYHYFGDKQTLIDALVEERCRVLLRAVKRIPFGEDAVQNLRAMCTAFVRFGLRYPMHYQLLAVPHDDEEKPPPPSAEAARVLMQSPLEQLAEAGRVPAGVEAAGQALWAYLHGHILLRTGRPDYEWQKGVLEIGLDALLRGLIRSGDPLAEPRERASRMSKR
jgi:AcrR family transcriptional regulator